ncbi:gem-associated protein 6-like [Pieris rapae]|uniref:gem-associated protein 6-like n=1 Tax=Pieris rapae TaxID=64459 RepID=UPI000B92BFC0|nr:gem-associated protein 6-like [Pieris rapae]
MDDISVQTYEFNASKEDPLFLNSLIFKYVKIHVLRDIVYHGYLESIDPLQYSVILSMTKGNECKKIFIPGHAVLNITVLDNFDSLKPKNNEVIFTAEDVLEKKQKMVSWFKKNLLPVIEEGENIVVGNISILPPYSENDICALNPIVATEVRKMILNMP